MSTPAQTNVLGKGSYGTVVIEGDKAVKYCCDPYNGIREYLWCKLFGKHASIIKHEEFKIVTWTRDNCNPVAVPWFEPNPLFKYKRDKIAVGIIKMKMYNTTLRRFASTGMTLDQYDFIIRKVMEGLYYLHANSIVHSDIKPDNILLNTSGRTINKVVLCDLGITNVVKYAEVDLTAGMYQDPNYKSNTYHDVYSLGVVMTRIFNFSIKPKSIPKETPANQRNALSRKFYDEYLALAIPGLPEPYRRLVTRMTSEKDRPSVKECMRTLNYPIPKMKEFYSNVYLDEYSNPHIDHTMNDIEAKINLGRARLGSYALREYLYRMGTLTPNRLPEVRYLNALTVILQSLYRSEKLPLKSIEPWCDTINELINDTQFIRNITTPSRYLNNGERSRRR